VSLGLATSLFNFDDFVVDSKFNLATPLVRNDKSTIDFVNYLNLEPEQDFELFGSETTTNPASAATNNNIINSHDLISLGSLADPSPLLTHDAGHGLGFASFVDFHEDAFGAEAHDLQSGTGSAVLTCDGPGFAAEPERLLV
jgi:hypothetical protein